MKYLIATPPKIVHDPSGVAILDWNHCSSAFARRGMTRICLKPLQSGFRVLQRVWSIITRRAIAPENHTRAKPKRFFQRNRWSFVEERCQQKRLFKKCQQNAILSQKWQWKRFWKQVLNHGTIMLKQARRYLQLPDLSSVFRGLILVNQQCTKLKKCYYQGN